MILPNDVAPLLRELERLLDDLLAPWTGDDHHRPGKLRLNALELAQLRQEVRDAAWLLEQRQKREIAEILAGGAP